MAKNKHESQQKKLTIKQLLDLANKVQMLESSSKSAQLQKSANLSEEQKQTSEQSKKQGDENKKQFYTLKLQKDSKSKEITDVNKILDKIKREIKIKNKDGDSEQKIQELNNLQKNKSDIETKKAVLKSECEAIDLSLKAFNTKASKGQPQKQITSTSAIKFTEQEVDHLGAYKSIFTATSHPKLTLFLNGEAFNASNVNQPSSSNLVEKAVEAKLKDILALTRKLQGKSASLNDEKIAKLIKLCDDKDPAAILGKAVKLIASNADANKENPIENFFEINQFGSYGLTNPSEWYKLSLTSKLAMQVLLPHSDKFITIPKSYDEGLQELAKIQFPKSVDIDKLDEKSLSPNMTKEKLWKFTKECVHANGTLKNSRAITDTDYDQALKILLDNDLKTKDNLPDVIIDGSDIGHGFEKYYMAKLQAGHPNGLILGKMTNNCQSLGKEGQKVAIEGTISDNSGFYLIFEKNSAKGINVEIDRPIAQSFGWLGQKTTEGGATLVLDSWERLSEDNDKLMHPFYSRFAEKVCSDYGISRVSLGKGPNTPNYIPYLTIAESKDEFYTLFEGVHPYPKDSLKQMVIYDAEQKNSKIGIIQKMFSLITDQSISEEVLLDYYNQYLVKLDSEEADVISSHQSNLLSGVAFYGRYVLLSKLLEHKVDVNIMDKDGSSPLHFAALSGHAEIIEMLIKHGADINIKDKQGDTPLLCAAKKGNAEIVEILLKHQASMTISDIYGLTPMHLAAFNGHAEIVEILLKHKADINIKDKQGNTPLLYSASKGHAEIVEILLKHGADVNIQNKDGDTHLLCAVVNGHAEIVEILLKHKADINIKDKQGNTPLLCATEKGHAEIVEMFIKHGADVNIQENRNGNTPLHFAALSGHAEIIEMFIKHGANPNIKNHSSSTPLYLAVLNGHAEIIEMLIKHGADINIKNKQGNTPLLYSASKGHAEIVEMFIKHGADVNIQENRNGNTPMHLAAFDGHVGIVEMLIKYRADVNIKNHSSSTPLYLAVLNGHAEIVEMFIKHGADVNIQENRNGNTPLLYAAKKGNAEIVEILLNAGANLNIQDKSDKTPLFCAVEHGDAEIIEILLKHKADINIKDNNGNTPLLCATQKGNTEIVEMLTNLNTKVNDIEQVLIGEDGY